MSPQRAHRRVGTILGSHWIPWVSTPLPSLTGKHSAKSKVRSYSGHFILKTHLTLFHIFPLPNLNRGCKALLILANPKSKPYEKGAWVASQTSYCLEGNVLPPSLPGNP